MSTREINELVAFATVAHETAMSEIAAYGFVPDAYEPVMPEPEGEIDDGLEAEWRLMFEAAMC